MHSTLPNFCASKYFIFIKAAKRSAGVLHNLATKKQYVLSELTNISKMDKTVLADVGTGAGLGLHDGAGAALFIADDAKLR